MASCRWCAAPIRWVHTESGRAMPLDEQPNTGGNVALIPAAPVPVARVLAGAKLTEWRGQLWMPHAATCPHNGTPARSYRGRT